jgi:hypothetical protein
VLKLVDPDEKYHEASVAAERESLRRVAWKISVKQSHVGGFESSKSEV